MYDPERYAVIRYARHFEVVDKQSNNRTVKSFRKWHPAHDFCNRLNRYMKDRHLTEDAGGKDVAL